MSEGSELGIWKIAESIDELRTQLYLSSEEEIFLESIGTEKRTLQWLSSRVLLRKMLAAQDFVDIRVDTHQKPYLGNYPHHISISHTSDYVSVMANETRRVGVDIEEIQTKIERVDKKFLSEEELLFIDFDQRIQHLYACWSAKEAVYKLHGKKEVSFKNNILLKPFTISDAGMIEATLSKDGLLNRFSVFYRSYETCMLAWVTESF